jgi:glucose dehydrogenase
VPFNYSVETTPLLIGDRFVVVSSEGDVAAIEAKSGKIVWRVAPAATLNRVPSSRHRLTQGIASSSPTTRIRRVVSPISRPLGSPRLQTIAYPVIHSRTASINPT